MNTRILTSVLSIVAVAGAVSTGTWAYFNASTANASNLFTTGNLSIDIASPTNAPVFNVTKMLPGQSTTGCLAVVNNGDLDEKWRAYLTNVTGNDELATALQVKVTLNPTTGCTTEKSSVSSKTKAGPDDLQVFSGNVLQLTNADTPLLSWQGAAGPFKPGWAGVYKIEVSLPDDAPNAIQGMRYGATIKIDATQVNNPGWL